MEKHLIDRQKLELELSTVRAYIIHIVIIMGQKVVTLSLEPKFISLYTTERNIHFN